jgi:hypothetical protein
MLGSMQDAIFLAVLPRYFITEPGMGYRCVMEE